MYLYRGLNLRDYCLYCLGKDINCNLSRESKNGYKHNIIYEVAHKNLSLSLDRTIGHVSGNNVKNSCWISTSSDYNFVLREYCIPQCGRYNMDSHRKNIIVIDAKHEIDETVDRNAINTSDFIGHYINLSNNNLQKYVKNKFIGPLSENYDSYFYGKGKRVHLDGDIADVQGFSNFSSGASEYLFYISIKNEDIKYIINPLMQDIIYSYTYGLKDNLLIEKIIDTCMGYENIIKNGIINNYYNFTDEEKSLIEYLYTEKDNKYNNVIDLVIENYDNSHDIVSDYECIKDLKRNILKKITGSDRINLADDCIYVINDELNNKGLLVNNKLINKKNKNDILYVTDKDGNLHEGNKEVKTIGCK